MRKLLKNTCWTISVWKISRSICCSSDLLRLFELIIKLNWAFFFYIYKLTKLPLPDGTNDLTKLNLAFVFSTASEELIDRQSAWDALKFFPTANRLKHLPTNPVQPVVHEMHLFLMKNWVGLQLDLIIKIKIVNRII